MCSHIHNKLLEIESVEGIEEIWSTIKKQYLVAPRNSSQNLRINVILYLCGVMEKLSIRSIA